MTLSPAARVRVTIIALVVLAPVVVFTIGRTAQANDPSRTLRVAAGASGDCINAPCGSFDAALRVARSGDTVEVAGGNYGSQTIEYHSAAASWSKNVVLRPAQGATVTVHALINKLPNVTFRNLHVKGKVDALVTANRSRYEQLDLDYAQVYLTGADDTAWIGNRIRPLDPWDGMQIKAHNGDNSTRTLIENNVIGPGYRIGDSHTDCIQLLGAHDTTIRGNTIYECGNANVQIGNGATGTVKGVRIEGNTMYECRPQRTECNGWHNIIIGWDVANSVEIVNNRFHGSVAVSGGAANPLVTGNVADQLPCGNRTDGNHVVTGKCGPNDKLVPNTTGPMPNGETLSPSAPTTTTTAAPTTTKAPTTTTTVAPTTTKAPTTTTTVAPTTTKAPTTTTTVAPTTTKAPTATQPSAKQPAAETTVDTFVGTNYVAGSTKSFGLSSGPGVVTVDLKMRAFYMNRAWATISLWDKDGRLIASGSTGAGAETSFTTTVPYDGVYRITLNSKAGDYVVTVTHPPKAPLVNPPGANPPMVEKFSGINRIADSTKTYGLSSGFGVVTVDLQMQAFYMNRAWATISIWDARGNLIGSAETGAGAATSFTAMLPYDGLYRITLKSKAGEYVITVTHPKPG